MANWITAYFETGGLPQTGLTVKVYVRDLSDNSLAVNGAVMTEVGNGWYKLDWADGTQASDYDPEKSYVGYCDSQSSNSDDRYVPIDFSVPSVKIDELHKLQGLDADNPMTVTPTSRVAGDISQTISGNGTTTTTVTRA